MSAPRRRPSVPFSRRRRDGSARRTPDYRVRLSDPGELAAALPHLIGFHPHESVVLISLTGPTAGVLGMTIRADIPPAEHRHALAGAVAGSVATDEPDAVVVAVVSEAPDEPDLGASEAPGRGLVLPHRPLVHELVLALDGLGIPVRQAMLIRRGRWWDFDCPYPCCAPGAGAPVPTAATELAAASVAVGQVVETDRAALAARIAYRDGPAAAAIERIVAEVGERYAADALLDPDRLVRRSWTAVRQAVVRCQPGRGAAAIRLSDREVARILWAVSDPQVRDRALGLTLGPDAPAAEVVWTECTRRAPHPLDAAPATLLAVSAWLRGDGAMANVALERALDSRPDYVLARLLADALAACLPPEELRALVADVADFFDPADQRP